MGGEREERGRQREGEGEGEGEKRERKREKGREAAAMCHQLMYHQPNTTVQKVTHHVKLFLSARTPLATHPPPYLAAIFDTSAATPSARGSLQIKIRFRFTIRAVDT